ncbi:MAG: B12-binding domain-containing radical SAM protein [Planctomycetota bacterium]
MRIAIVIPSNGSKFHWYPLGAMQAANALEKVSYEPVIVHQDITDASHKRILAALKTIKPFAVAMGWIAGRYPHDNCVPLARAIAREGYQLIIGGHAPSSDPEWYLAETGATACIIGEADGVTDWADYRGVIQGRPSPIWWPYLDESHLMSAYYGKVPAPGATPVDMVSPVMSGFGCPYKCSFCYRLTKGRRQRPIEEIDKEIRYLKKWWSTTFVQFQDELLMTDVDRIDAICKLMTDQDLRWSCQGRVNVAAESPEILREMKKAGCCFINYGIESMSHAVLKKMRKKQTPEQARIAVKATKGAGIAQGLNMLWGCPGDTEASLRANVRFLLAHADHVQRRTIRPVTPYPGSFLYKQLVKEKKVKDTGDFYRVFANSDLISFDFMNIKRETAHRMLYKANMQLLERHEKTLLKQIKAQARSLYIDNNTNFRGWRQI